MRTICSTLLCCAALVFALDLGDESWGAPNGFEWFSDVPQKKASLTLLPQYKSKESPACLDGSPYGFYFVPSAIGSTKWTFSILGGGWCRDEEECFGRSQDYLGSSKNWHPKGKCGCMNALEDGSMDGNCNCISMGYCDGASFAGFRAEAWPVPSNTSRKLYFRGIKNFDATMDFALENGLDKATEFVLTGFSAGGLATLLHADRVRQRLAKEAPDCRHVRAAPLGGFFLDYNFMAGMEYIYDMQNLTSHTDGGLLPACAEAYPENKHYCFMGPHMQQFIQTPFFMFNSKYDSNVLSGEIHNNWNTKESQAIVIRYGEDFLEHLKPLQSEPQNGAMITSCMCHGCPWAKLVLQGKTSYQHYADWYYGKTSGSAAIHIDARYPNGDGSLDFQTCLHKDSFLSPRPHHSL